MRLSQEQMAAWIRHYQATGLLPRPKHPVRDAPAPRRGSSFRDSGSRRMRFRDASEAFWASARRVKKERRAMRMAARDDLPQRIDYPELRAYGAASRWGVGAPPGPSMDPRLRAVARRIAEEIGRGERPYAIADLRRVAAQDMPGALAEFNKRNRDYWDGAESILGQNAEVVDRISGPGQTMGIGERQHGLSEEELRNSGPPGSYLPPGPPIDTGRHWTGRFGDALRWSPSRPGCEASGLAALAEEHRRWWGQK